MNHSISEAIASTLNTYFETLEKDPKGLYDLVISQTEQALLKYVMNHTNQNQSRASKILTLSRNTLRARLNKYQIGTE